MPRLTFLGTGCGYPVPDRFHTSILLETGASRILLDAGEPCSHFLRAMGVGLETLDAVLISHGHSDHIGGLPMLLQGAWLSPREAPFPIYLPGELIVPLRAWLDAVYLPQSLMKFPIHWCAWETESCYQAQGIRVFVSPTTHLHSLGQQIAPADGTRFKAYAMEIEMEGMRLIYSGDLGAASDLEALLVKPADVLVCELAHFTPAELFGFLKGKRVGRVILTHLSPDNQIGEARLAELAEAEMGSSVLVELARDGVAMEL